MFGSKVEKLVAKYKTGDEVEAFRGLLRLTVSGKPDAQFALASICSDNGLRFLASDSWADLLEHQVEPRELVSRNQYETLIWLGDAGGAQSFIENEGLFDLADNLAERNLVLSPQRLRKELTAHLLGLKKIQIKLNLSQEERRFEELELGAGIAYISSQIHFSGKSVLLGSAALFSGSDDYLVDFDSYIHPPEELWMNLLFDSVDLLRELIDSEPENPVLVRKVATFAQDIQERMFFFKAQLSVASEAERYCLSVIATALSPMRPVAAEMYFSLIAR